MLSIATSFFDFLKFNVELFDCDDDDFDEIYNYFDKKF